MTFLNQLEKFSDFNEPGRVLGLSISGELLYIASGPGWIYVLDISDPEKPKRMYQIDNLNVANDVAIVGEYMYMISQYQTWAFIWHARMGQLNLIY